MTNLVLELTDPSRSSTQEDSEKGTMENVFTQVNIPLPDLFTLI